MFETSPQFKISESLTPERLQSIISGDQPNLTAPGGQPIGSVGPNRIRTKIITINGTQFNETVAVVHVDPEVIRKLVHKGTDGFWAKCAAATIPSIANNVTRFIHLVAGETNQVGSVYGGSPSGESWVVTGISANCIRLVPTTKSAELGPMGILVERHPYGPKGAIVRVRGPVSNDSGAGWLSALGCCGDTTSGESRLLRQLDTCRTGGRTGGIADTFSTALNMQMTMESDDMHRTNQVAIKKLNQDSADNNEASKSTGNDSEV